LENTNSHLILTSKKGMSALQIYRSIGFGLTNAWEGPNRAPIGDIGQLSGVMDETFIGGLSESLT
jgi:hypothetical protein